MSIKENKIISLRLHLRRLSMYRKILIGNSVIIILGAIFGTLITNYMAGLANDIWLILLFSSIGILMSIVLNSIIIKQALKPLYRLRQVIARIDLEQSHELVRTMTETDPSIAVLAAGIDEILQKLGARTARLSAISERLIYVQEEERLRIAQELHDDTGQALSMLSMTLDQIKEQVADSEPILRKEISRAQDLSTTTLKDLRKIIYGLRPTMLDDLGLIPAIRWYAKTCLNNQTINIEINSELTTDQLPYKVKTALFRIAQETINNIEKYAKARNVTINLYPKANLLHMEIIDDGDGFHPEEVRTLAVQEKKLGLLGIQERAEIIGGVLAVESFPGSGTSVKISVPFSHGIKE